MEAQTTPNTRINFPIVDKFLGDKSHRDLGGNQANNTNILF